MQRSQYIPGFDWMRIIGSVLVVFRHCGAFDSLIGNNRTLAGVLSVLIPTFFIMSGFLCGRRFSRERIRKQVIKYGSIYLAVEFVLVLWTHLSDLIKYGSFSFTGLAVNFFKCFVIRNDMSGQLWFIPALLYAMILNAFLGPRSRKIVIAAAALLTVFLNIAGEGCITETFGKLVSSVPALGKVFGAEELSRTFAQYAAGLLFTTVGFDIVSWKIRPVFLLAAAVPVAVFEVFVFYAGVSSILLSILFFYSVKIIPGRFMFPFHTEISVFAGTNFFLHMIERLVIYNFITQSIPLIIIFIVAFNLVVTFAASFCFRKCKRDKEASV